MGDKNLSASTFCGINIRDRLHSIRILVQINGYPTAGKLL